LEVARSSVGFINFRGIVRQLEPGVAGL